MDVGVGVGVKGWDKSHNYACAYYMSAILHVCHTVYFTANFRK